MMRFSKPCVLLSAAMIGASLMAPPALALSNPMDVYTTLQTAIALQAKCSKTPFTQAQRVALEAEIERQAGGLLGAGEKLTAIEAAKSKAATTSCTSAAGAELLRMYEGSLSSKLP